VSPLIKHIIEARLIESIEAKLEARELEASSEEEEEESSLDASDESSSSEESTESMEAPDNVMQEALAEQIQEQLLFGGLPRVRVLDRLHGVDRRD
jgi:hypothetical protein